MHIAFIMDGNGRWATNKGLSRCDGHNKGVEVAKEIMIACLENKDITYASFYALSMQNWKRDNKELNHIMRIAIDSIEEITPNIKKYDCKLKFLGNIQHLPENIQQQIYSFEAETANCKGKVLSICLSYGGREEILDVFRKVKQDLNTLTTKEISDLFPLPDVDLVVRTSGEYRISNFMLWQSAYAEYYFTNTLWPDFTVSEMENSIKEFKSRDRRFGGVKEEKVNIPSIQDKYALMKELFNEYTCVIDHTQLYNELKEKGYKIEENSEEEKEDKYRELKDYCLSSDSSLELALSIDDIIDNKEMSEQIHGLKLLYTDYSVETIEMILKKPAALLYNNTSTLEKELMKRVYECEYLQRISTDLQEKAIHRFLSNYYFFNMVLKDILSEDMLFLYSIIISFCDDCNDEETENVELKYINSDMYRIISNVIKEIIDTKSASEYNNRLIFIGISVLLNRFVNPIQLPKNISSYFKFVIGKGAFQIQVGARD